MRILLLTGTALIGLSASTVFANAVSTVNTSNPPAVSRDIGRGPAMAGTGFGGPADSFMPENKTATVPGSITLKPSRIDPPNLFSTPWGAGGSG